MILWSGYYNLNPAVVVCWQYQQIGRTLFYLFIVHINLCTVKVHLISKNVLFGQIQGKGLFGCCNDHWFDAILLKTKTTVTWAGVRDG